MKIIELVEQCSKAISLGKRVQLVVPRQTKGERVTLAGRGTPLGEVCCENTDGSTVEWFDPTEVLMCLVKNGAIRAVEVEGNKVVFEVMGQ